MTGRGYCRVRFTPDWLPETLELVVIIIFSVIIVIVITNTIVMIITTLAILMVIVITRSSVALPPQLRRAVGGKDLGQGATPTLQFPSLFSSLLISTVDFSIWPLLFFGNFVTFVPIYFAQFHLFFFRIFDALCFDTFSASLTLSLVQFPHVFKLSTWATI